MGECYKCQALEEEIEGMYEDAEIDRKAYEDEIKEKNMMIAELENQLDSIDDELLELAYKVRMRRVD